MKILVTGAGEILGQAAIKSIKASHFNPKIIALNASPYGAGLYWADQHYIIPRADEISFKDEIRDILAIERPDLIIIGTAHEYSVFADMREEIENEYNTKVLVSSRRVIDLAADKWSTHLFLKENKLDHPEACLPGSEESLIDKVGFPLIVKPRIGSGSVGVVRVQSLKELEIALSNISHPIIQECVGTEDEEYTAGVVVFNGKALSSIAMKRELRHGNTSIARAEAYSEVNAYLEKIAEKLDAHGPINLQYRLVDNRVKLFEINARLSGTSHFRTLSNVNELEICISYLLNQVELTQPEIRPAHIVRYYDEVVLPNNIL